MAANFRKIIYSGDINIEHGGMFYRLDTWGKDGYQDILRVVPASDAGCAENCFWIEHLVVNLKEGLEHRRALEASGLNESPDNPPEAEIEAYVGYGLYEQYTSSLFQFGFKQSEYGEPIKVAKSHILRGNTDLRRFALRKFREHC